jgi:hypothetical protein
VHDNGVNEPAPTSVYWPVMMDRFEGQKEAVRRDIAFAVRSPRAGSEAFAKEIRQVVRSLDPDLPLADVHTVGYFYTKSMARTSFTLVMLAAAGGKTHTAPAHLKEKIERARRRSCEHSYAHRSLVFV